MQVPGKNEKWNDTDYDIPKFSYPSAFLIFGVTFLVTCLTIWISNGNRWAIIATLSFSIATTTAVSRFYIDTKRGMCPQFIKLWLLLLISCSVILYFVKF